MPDSPKPPPSRRRRRLKRVGILILAIALIAGVLLAFLPQIATKVIKQLLADLELDRFEVTVVEVRWNSAVLADLNAADAGWQARAGKVVVQYDPWDLIGGKVKALTIHELKFELLHPAPAATSATATAEVPPAADKAPYGWLHDLPETLADFPAIMAPNATITVPRGPESSTLTARLVWRRPASGRLDISLESEGQKLTADLERTTSGSTLSVQVTASDPDAWLTTTETLLGASDPYLPADLALGPLQGNVHLRITDQVEKIEVSGSMTGLRYGRDNSAVEALSSSTTFDGVIRPGGESHVDLRGDLTTYSMKHDAIPGGTLNLPTRARPTWTTRLAWSAESFSYAGTLADLQLHGGEAGRPLEITGGAANFSNRTATFRTDGKLRLNGLELPFDFALDPAGQSPGNTPNTKLGVGPVTLESPHPILAAFLPDSDLGSLTGTFAADLALRLTPDDPVSGTVAISIADADCQLGGDLVALGPLTGTARITLPADGSAPDFGFAGTLKALTLDTTGALGFPLTHRSDTPAEINLTGQVTANSPTVEATIGRLSLEGAHNGHEVRFADTALEVSYRGDELSASLASRFGTTPLACTYRHTRKELPDGQWHLQGKFALSPTTTAGPVTNAAAFSDALAGMSFSGTIASELEFQAGSERGFSGALKLALTDCGVALKDEVVVVRGLSGGGAVTFPTGEASPVTWQMEGSAKGLSIDTSDAIGFPLTHDAATPAAFTVSGSLDDTGTTAGSISKLTLNGEHRGEFVSFADSALDFRLAGDRLTADGRTSYAGNEIPFRYRHTRKVAADESWELNGALEVPLVSLDQAIMNGGAFSDVAAGISYTGKTAAKSIFHLGSNEEFRGTLDLTITDGTVTLPDNGPVLSGIKTRFVTPDLNTLHTVQAESFTIKSLSYGDLSFTKLTGRYQIRANQDIALSHLSSGFLGGRLSIDPFTIPGDDQKDYRMQTRFTGIDLHTLTGLFPSFDGKLEGRIDGVLPIVRRNGVYQPERGGIHLTPRTRARLRYNADKLLTGRLAPGSNEFKRMKLAEDSLKNLSIPILSGRLFDPKDKDRAAVIRIEGQSPGIKDAPPIHLNFNLFEPEGEFRELVDYFFKNREKLDFGL